MPLRLVLCGFLALGTAHAQTPGVFVDQIGQPRSGATQIPQQRMGDVAGARAVIAPGRARSARSGPTSQGDGVSPLAETCARAADGGQPIPPECAALRQQAQAAAQKSTPEGTLLYLFGQQAAPTRTTSAVTRDGTDADSVARDLASEAAGSDAGSDAAAIAARQRPTPSPGPR